MARVPIPVATPAQIERAKAHLAEVDPLFKATIERAGPLRIAPSKLDHLSYLVRAIIYQQLAGAAARTIHGRFVSLLGDELSAASLLALSEDAYRQAGISKNKYLAIVDLAERFAAGKLFGSSIDHLDDESIIEHLSEVRGIGRWTAQMFLMTQLRRLDVWPTGDLGVRHGYGLMHGIERPTPKALDEAGERLRPYRSIAAIYCWRAVALAKDEPPSVIAPSGA